MLEELHRKFASVYSPAHLGGIASSCFIHEPETSATVKDLHIQTSGQLFEVSNCFQKALSGIHNYSQQCTALASDCDGVLIVELDNHPYILFVELKSSYSKSQIGKAQKQLLTGYFKLLVHLNVIDIFNFEDWKFCSIIASHPVKTEDMRLFQQWQQQNSLDRYSEKALFFAMHKDETHKITIDEVSDLEVLPIKFPYLCKEIPLFHIDVPTSSTSVTFDIDSLLRTI